MTTETDTEKMAQALRKARRLLDAMRTVDAAWADEDGDPMAAENLVAEIETLLAAHESRAQPASVAARNTMNDPPEKGQRVLYWFEPFGKWWIGQYDDGTFHGPQGFCDKYDAPYWMPEPAAPQPPAKCEHSWITAGLGHTHCSKCGELSNDR